MAIPGITRDFRRGAAQRLGFEHLLGTMARHEPGVADTFARTSAIVLRDCMTSGKLDNGWSGGNLNRNGAPLEISFSTMSDDVRYTVELAGAQTPPERRLARLDALLDELGHDPEWHGVARRFPELQRDAPLKYGAWLGIRHRRAISSEPATTFKIYAEVPVRDHPGTSKLLADHLGASVVSGSEAQLVMIGSTPDSDRCEFYFEWLQRRLTVAALERLMSQVGLETELDNLLELIRSFHFRADADTDALAEAQYGFSYSAQPDGSDPRFSVFVFSSDLAGGDGYLRREILTVALRRGWRLGCYAALTRPFAQRFFQSGFHNLLTFTVGPDRMIGFQLSLSPPPEFIHDD